MQPGIKLLLPKATYTDRIFTETQLIHYYQENISTNT